MYNKLFTKILDSSIWLQPTSTRIVWLTFIAVMNEDGFVQFASVANVAHRARVSLVEAQEAIACLEGPDPESSNPDHEGRRIERVPGGWIVLNAEPHRAMVTKTVMLEQTKERVRRHREKKRISNACVTPCNAPETPSNGSEAYSRSRSEAEVPPLPPKGGAVVVSDAFDRFWAAYPRKKSKGDAEKAFRALKPTEELLARMLTAIAEQRQSVDWTKDGGQYIPYPASWLRARRWEDAPTSVLVSPFATTGRTAGNAAALAEYLRMVDAQRTQLDQQALEAGHVDSE